MDRYDLSLIRGGVSNQASGAPTPQEIAAGAKPVVPQKSGTISTEKTITIEADGKHFVIPTIIDGKSYTPDAAADAFMARKIQPIAEFNTAEEARVFAEQRSRDLDKAFGGSGKLTKGASDPASGKVLDFVRRGVRSEDALRPVVALTPQEQAAEVTKDASAANLAELDREIARTSDPKALATLKQERSRIAAAGPAPAPKTPLTWADVTKLPEMQRLSSDDFEAARHQYFVDVVAPQVPTDQLDAARAAFDEDTKPGMLDTAARKLSGVTRAIREGGSVVAPVSDFVRRGIRRIDKSFEQPRSKVAEDAPYDRPFMERVQGYMKKGFDSATADTLARKDRAEGVDRSQPEKRHGAPFDGKLGREVTRGLGMLSGTIDGIRMSGIAEMLDAKRAQKSEAELAGDAEYQQAVKDYQRIRADMEHRNKELDRLPRSAAVRKMFEGDGAEGWDNFVDAFKKDPGGAMAVIVGGSAPASLGMVAAATLARFGFRNNAAAVAGGGLASTMTEFGNDYAENRNAGMNHEEAYNRAAVKSGVIGLFDAASLGSAGKAIDEIAEATGLTAGIKKYVKESGKQATLGAGGETVGSVASGKEPQPGAVAAEALGEVVMGVTEGFPAAGGIRQPAAPGVAASAETPMPAAAGGVSAPVSADELLGTVEQPAPVAAAPAPAPSSGANSATDIKQIFGGMGGGVVDALYQGLFDSLKAGKDTMAGVKDPVLARAKPAFDAGLIKTPEDIQRFEKDGYPTIEAKPAAPVVDNAEPAVDKDGWAAFPPESGTLGVPRAEMPQVKAEHRGALVNFLKGRGVTSEKEEVAASTLKATQAEYSPAKVTKAQNFEGGDRSILISSDNYVVDGHHQWLAKASKEEPVQVIRLNAPIKDLLPLVSEFPSAGTAPGAKTAPAAPGFSDAEIARREKLKQKSAARKRIDPATDSIIKAIAKLGGVGIEHRLDITGNDKGNRQVPFVGHLFSSNGRGLDDMATSLGQYGYLTEEELNSVDGGVQALRDKIRDEFDGVQSHYSSIGAEDRMAQEREEQALSEQERVEVADIADEVIDEIEAAGGVPDEWSTMSEEQKNEELDSIFGSPNSEAVAQGENGAAKSRPPETGQPDEAEEVAPAAADKTPSKEGVSVSGVEARELLDHIETEMSADRGDADMLSNAEVKPFEGLLADSGWTVHKEGKVSDWRKDGWILFLRSQGEFGSTIAQWYKDKTGKTDATPKATEAKPAASKTPKPKKQGKDPLAKTREHFTPGNIVYSNYWRNHDRVLAFETPDTGGWRVQVERVDKKDGQWVSVGEPRWHQTLPTAKDKVIERAAEKQDAVDDEAKLPAKSQQLFGEWGGKRYPVESLEDASRKWQQFRDATGEGVSVVGNGIRVTDQDGKDVARISYNGRVWPPGEAQSGEKPLQEAAAVEPAALELKGETPADLQLKAQKEATAATLKAAEALKDAADAVRESFTLSGSNRAADEAAARGQQNLLGSDASDVVAKKHNLKNIEVLPNGQMIGITEDGAFMLTDADGTMRAVQRTRDLALKFADGQKFKAANAGKPETAKPDLKPLIEALIKRKGFADNRAMIAEAVQQAKDVAEGKRGGEAAAWFSRQAKRTKAGDAVTSQALADVAAAIKGLPKRELPKKEQTPAQKAAFAEMLEKKRQKAEDKGEATDDAPADTEEAESTGGDETIEDFGQKIGGARKDTAKPVGKRGTSDAEESAEPGWRKRFTVSEIVAGNDEGKWVLHDNRKKDFRGRPRQVGELFSSKEDAELAIPLAAVSQKHRAVPVSIDKKVEGGPTTAYEIWRDVTDKKRLKVVDQQFATREDALRYMAEHAVEIIETKTSFGEEILVKPEKVMRRGAQRRTAPATPAMFADTFGFRGVEFGNWNNQDERQEVMNHAFDGLLDLAEVLKIPPKALSLNGDLALAFGARGQGLSGAKAHYEADYGVINLTKMTGAGSLAHEWLHAADHYFARQDGKAKSERIKNAAGDLVYDSVSPRMDMASHGFSAARSGVREEVRAAYTDLMNTMFTKGVQYVEDTQKAEKFVGGARNSLAKALDEIRTNLTRGPKELTYMKRNNKPASAEQLAQFDQLSEKLISGEALEVAYRPHPESEGVPMSSRKFKIGRRTNDTLEAMSAILKTVRGRSGFNAENGGTLDGLRYLMKVYLERINMLKSAEAQETKTKRVPTSYAMDAKRIDQGRASNYWTTEHEMAARAFSAYVEDKVAEQGNRSDFLAYGSDNKYYVVLNLRPFPEGTEREAINKAFDKLFATLQTKDTDAGTAMFSIDAPDAVVKKNADNGLPTLGNSTIIITDPRQFGVAKGLTLYNLYDPELWRGSGRDRAKVGALQVDIDENGQITDLSGIFIDKELQTPRRGQRGMDRLGYGEKVIRAILASLPEGDGFSVTGILPEARGFWEKMGARIEPGRIFDDGYITRESYERNRTEIQDGTGSPGLVFESRGGDTATTADSGGSRSPRRSDGSDRQKINEAPARGLSVSEAAAEIGAEVGNKASKIRIVETVDELPDSLKQQVLSKNARRVQGVFDPQTRGIYLVSRNIQKGNAFPVLMHEAGVHLGLEGIIGADGIKKLAGQIRTWASFSGSTDHGRLAKTAVAKVPANTAAAHRDQEVIAYFVEEAVKAGHGDPKPQDKGAISRWFRQLWAMVRDGVRKLGADPSQLTVDDIVAMARGALERSLAPAHGPLYHGTSRGNRFAAYDPKKAKSGVGGNAFDQGDYFYMTTSKTAARWFARRAEENKQLKSGKTPENSAEGEVIKFRLADGARVMAVAEMPRGKEAAAKVIGDAKAQGYDAVSFPDRGFLTVEGDSMVGDMLNTEGIPQTVIVINNDALVSDDQTQTEAFKKWFGDSKVVDADGKPLVVYHGTRQKDLTEFDSEKIQSGVGFWFSENKMYADGHRYGINKKGQQTKGDLVEAYLSIQNPARTIAEANRGVDDNGIPYDGYIPKQGGTYVAFKPEQIKSAVGNRGTFDGKDANILMSRDDGAGMQFEDVNAVANLFRKKFKGMPTIYVMQSLRQAPDALRRDIKELGGQNDTAAAWHNGEIYLFADNISDPEHAVWAVLHEATHHGLRGMLGNSLDSVLMDIYMSNDAVRAAASKTKEANPNLTIVQAVEEVLADLGGDNIPQPVWKRLLAAFRRAIRSMGKELELTDDDVRDLVTRALRFAKSPQKQTHLLIGTALNRISPADDAINKPDVPVTELELEGWSGTKGDLAKLARDIYSSELQGTTERNTDMGVDVYFGAEGKHQAFSTSGNIRHGWRAEMVKAVRRLVHDAVRVASAEPDSRKAGNTKAMHVMVAPLSVNGRVYTAKIVLREALQDTAGAPHKFYDIAALEMEHGPVSDGPGAVSSTRTPDTSEPRKVSVRQMLTAFKGENLKYRPTALSRNGVSQPAATSKKRTGMLDTALRVPTQLLGIDKLTTWAYDGLIEKVGALVPEKVKAGVVADYGMPEAVIDRRSLMQAHMKTALRQTQGAVEKLLGLTRAESRVAYQWMTGQEADQAAIDRLPADSKATLQQLRALITSLGSEAVRLGQLSKETHEKNATSYLHRSYLKHETEQTDQQKARRGRAIKVLGDQYKGRGMVDGVPMTRIKAAAPEWWGRKLQGGKADKALKGEKFIRFERRAPRGEGVDALPGMQNTGQLGKLLEVQYWPAGETVPARYGAWNRDSAAWEVRDVKGPDAVMWRDFTAEERTRMGEIDEVRYAVAKTMHQMIHDIEVGRYLEWLSSRYARPNGDGLNVVEASERILDTFKEGEWVKVPGTEIPGTSVKRYGALAGKFLPGPIWNDVRQVASPRFAPLGDTYATVLKAWKISKTALSPAVHLNNVMANMIMADWHDVQATDLARALKVMIVDSPENKKMLDLFEDNGGTQGMFVLSEIQRDQLKPLLDALQDDVGAAGGSGMINAAAVLQALIHGGSVGDRLQKAAAAAADGKVAGLVAKAAGLMIDAYQAEDTVFRLAAFMKAKQGGASDVEAGKFARKSFLDYHINAPWIQAMRSTFFPFISFVYRAAPMMLETAAKKPWKLMKLALVLGGLNALGYMLSGGDEDDERKLLPEEKRGKIFGFVAPKLLRMPWNDAHGSPVFLDIRRFIPVGDIFDVDQTHGAMPLLPAMIPGGPLATLAELALNKVQFTGRPITKETDTGMEKTKAIVDHLFKAFAPNLPFLPGSYSFKSIFDAGSGKTDAFGRERNLPQAVLSSVGVKLASYPADVAKRGVMLDHGAKVREIGENISKLKRELQQKGITREEFDEKLQAQLTKRRKIDQEARNRLR